MRLSPAVQIPMLFRSDSARELEGFHFRIGFGDQKIPEKRTGYGSPLSIAHIREDRNGETGNFRRFIVFGHSSLFAKFGYANITRLML